VRISDIRYAGIDYSRVAAPSPLDDLVIRHFLLDILLQFSASKSVSLLTIA